MYRDRKGKFISHEAWMKLMVRRILEWGFMSAVDLFADGCRQMASSLCVRNPEGARLWLDRADRLKALRGA